jgi:hypothetical protein
MMKAVDNDSHPSAEFQLTKDDFAAAYQLHFVLTRSGWLFCALFVSASCTAMLFLLRYENAPLWVQLLLPVFMMLGGALAGTAAWAVFAPWLGRRTYARQPLARLTMRITLRPEGLRFQSSRGDSTLLWKDFISWRANSKTTLLYVSPHSFLHIPARLGALGFSTDDLKATLAREIGAPRR